MAQHKTSASGGEPLSKGRKRRKHELTRLNQHFNGFDPRQMITEKNQKRYDDFFDQYVSVDRLQMKEISTMPAEAFYSNIDNDLDDDELAAVRSQTRHTPARDEETDRLFRAMHARDDNDNDDDGPNVKARQSRSYHATAEAPAVRQQLDALLRATSPTVFHGVKRVGWIGDWATDGDLRQTWKQRVQHLAWFNSFECTLNALIMQQCVWPTSDERITEWIRDELVAPCSMHCDELIRYNVREAYCLSAPPACEQHTPLTGRLLEFSDAQGTVFFWLACWSQSDGNNEPRLVRSHYVCLAKAPTTGASEAVSAAAAAD
jgi:hypothetical protein